MSLSWSGTTGSGQASSSVPEMRSVSGSSVLYGSGPGEVLIVDGSKRPMPEGAIRRVDERAALGSFCEGLRAVLTGWNIV